MLFDTRQCVDVTTTHHFVDDFDLSVLVGLIFTCHDSLPDAKQLPKIIFRNLSSSRVAAKNKENNAKKKTCS